MYIIIIIIINIIIFLTEDTKMYGTIFAQEDYEKEEETIAQNVKSKLSLVVVRPLTAPSL